MFLENIQIIGARDQQFSSSSVYPSADPWTQPILSDSGGLRGRGRNSEPNQFPGEADAAFLDYKAVKVRSKNSEKGKTDAGEEE